MQSLTDLLLQGNGHAWLFLPTAILLGALHGLEPGHSKTMMAAFIVAIRGTVPQAILLGLSAMISHTAVVWAIALGGLYFRQNINTESVEPYLQLVSAVILIIIAAWMFWRTWRDRRLEATAHIHDHDHHHHNDLRRIDTGNGIVELEVFEKGAPPRWRLRAKSGPSWAAKDVSLATTRPDGAKQVFAFADRGAYLESFDEIPEPHEFVARVSLGHADHMHHYDVLFIEGHSHDHLHEEKRGLKTMEDDDFLDAHQRAHADDISRHFADRSVTTSQIIIFGLTGGLIPCPAAITVLLLCLQLKQLLLGIALVAFFSIGLAITLVSVGVIASLSITQAQKHWSRFGALARRVPYASGILTLLIAFYMAASGWLAMAARM